VLELKFTLPQDELNHNTRDKGQRNRCHEDKIIGARSLLDVDELLVNWKGRIDYVVDQIRVTCRDAQNCLVHVLRKHGCHVLRCNIEVVNDLVLVASFVGLEDLV